MNARLTAIMHVATAATTAAVLLLPTYTHADPPPPAAVADVAVPANDGLDDERIAIQQARQRVQASGYEVCDPQVGPLPNTPEAEDAQAWAAWPSAHGVCLIEIRPATSESADPTYLDHVAVHEVCHLATGPMIQADEARFPATNRPADFDPYHEGAFKHCMRLHTGLEY